MTKSVFRLFSVVYIAGIFLLAGSSVVSDLAPFNPYSLLHIPLYGILTLFLFFSFVPLKSHSTYSTNSTDSTRSDNSTHLTRFVFPGVIALTVAIADEIHQAYIPGRNASVVDVFLDVIGIGLCLLAIKHFS